MSLFNLKGDFQIVILVAVGQCSIIKKTNENTTAQKILQKENVVGSPGYVT